MEKETKNTEKILVETEINQFNVEDFTYNELKSKFGELLAQIPTDAKNYKAMAVVVAFRHS